MRDYDCGAPAVLTPSAFRGYRLWRSDPGKGWLRSISQYRVWPPGTFTAECLNDARNHGQDILVPAPHCTCGIYAMHHPLADPNYRTTYMQPFGWLDTTVLGVVESTGSHRLGVNGYKAQQARIVAVVAKSTKNVRVLSVRRNFERPFATVVIELEIPRTDYNTYVSLTLSDDLAGAGRASVGDHVGRLFRELDARYRSNYPDIEVCGSLDELLSKYPPIRMDALLS